MKIALILNDDFSMWHFRKGLLNALVDRKYDVCTITPDGPYTTCLKKIGVRHIPVAMDRFINPISDICLIINLYRIFRREDFDVVHTMTIKPNIYGTIAARLARVPKIVGLVSGAGFVYAEGGGLKSKLLRYVTTQLYRISMRLNCMTWFQNSDDLDLFVAKKIVTQNKAVVIRSGGINTLEFSMDTVPNGTIAELRKELQIPIGTHCIVMIAARMIWSKGVKEFLDAAALLKNKFPGWLFLMLCPKDPDSPEAVPDDYIDAQRNKNVIILDRFRPDVKNIVALADIMVLASYYREGVPRTLLEGLAMSKSIVTTDSIGCREVVEEGINGFLVPVKNAPALAEKLSILMNNDEMRKKFGKASRKLAEDVFDEKIIVGRIITELYGIH